MATTAERIAKALAECEVLSTAVTRQGEIQSKDHDEIIKIGRDVKTLFEHEKEYVTASENETLCDRVARLEKAQERKGVRQWQIWLAVLTSVLGPVLVILIMRAMGLLAQTPTPTP
jgi:hypothetical protein